MSPCADPNYLPRWQAQNPAISGYYLGWSSCAAYSGAMGAAYETCGRVDITGRTLRVATGDTTGGLNLAQIDDALRRNWNIDLDTRYGLTWYEFVRKINAGMGAHLQGNTIAFTRASGFYSADPVNHSIFVPPGWGAMDPAADGRRTEVHKYNGAPYPQSLLRSFAGALIVNPSTGGRLGVSKVYAQFTRDQRATYFVTIRPLSGNVYREYTRYLLNADGRIAGHEIRRTKGFRAPSSPPRLFRTASGTRSVSLGRIQKPGSVYDGWYVSSRWVETVP